MPRTTPSLLPRLCRQLTLVGENLRLARLRRRLTTETIAERAGITRKTLGRVERGDPAVAMGVYARVMQALGFVDDLSLLGRDDELGRKLQDLALTTPRRASRRKRNDEQDEERH